MARTVIGFSSTLRSLNKRPRDWRTETACLIPPTPRITQGKEHSATPIQGTAVVVLGACKAVAKHRAVDVYAPQALPASELEREKGRGINEGYACTTKPE